MAYVEVDVDLGDFETYELVDELYKRCKNLNRLTARQKSDLKESLTDLSNAFGFIICGTALSQSLEDKMKMELLDEVLNKYTYWQLLEKLK